MSERQITPYNGFVPRSPSKPKAPRPAQGARMLAFRKAAGLTQTELADAIGETQVNISFWERTDKPPRSDVLPGLAKALGVTVDDILGLTKSKKTSPLAKQTAKPAGQVQKAFEEIRKLPRRQQQKILDVVFAMLDQQDRKAG